MEELFDAKDLMNLNFEDLEKKIYDYVCNIGRQITVYMLEQIDENLMKNRDKKRYKSKQIRQTTIKTVYGEVEYSRRMYLDKQTNEYVYLLDDSMQMERIGQISTNLAKKITEAVSEMPFRKAAKVISHTTGQVISSHGVWDVAQKVGTMIQQEEYKQVENLEKEQTEGKQESQIVFTETDGVWLKIQKNKKKTKSRELKLATIYDGWDGDFLHNRLVIAGMETGKDFNLKTEALTQSFYDIDAAQYRVLNGDGAKWIKNTYDPEMIFQLDPFHVEQEIIRKISNKKIRGRVREAYHANDPDKMLEIIDTYINSIDDGTKKNEIKNAKKLYEYLKNNKEGLTPWQKQIGEVPEPPEGLAYRNMGTQENHNSSLVCGRMKGHKKRWSVTGASNLAKIICVKENNQLDKIIEKADGVIQVPDNLDLGKLLSAAKSKAPVRKGNKYFDIAWASVPLLGISNNPSSVMLRNIINK